MNRVTRRKPRNYKGITPAVCKSSRRELSATERAFIAGACIAGSLSHNSILEYFNDDRTTKSTVTRTTQHIQKIAEELSCKITDSQCFENLAGRSRVQKISDKHKAKVIKLTTSNRNYREKEA
jgi:phosphohistidine phosphatase SixA